MAKKARVKLTPDSEWLDVEVPNIYRPDIHHTVRLPGEATKTKYYEIELGGRVYNKETNQYTIVTISGVYTDLDMSSLILEGTLPLVDGSVESAYINYTLQECSDLCDIMAEVHRVLADGGTVAIKTFIAPHKNAFTSPRNKLYFNEHTFDFFLSDGADGLFARMVKVVRGDTLEILFRK